MNKRVNRNIAMKVITDMEKAKETEESDPV